MNINFLAKLFEITAFWKKFIQLDVELWKGNRVGCWFDTFNSMDV